MQLLRPLPFTTTGSGVTHGTGLATVGEVSYMLTRPLWQTVPWLKTYCTASPSGVVQ